MITPKEIENKEFASSVRGYKKEEVDVFLDEVMLDYQRLLDENKKLRNSVDDLNREIAECKKSESSVMNTLEQAKNLMSDISASAEKRAEVIIKNAQLDAEKITRDARDSVSRLTDESEQLKRRVSSFKEKYKRMLNDELAKVDGQADDFFADLKDDFYPASMAEAASDKAATKVEEPAVDRFRTSELNFDFDMDDGDKQTSDVTLTEKVLEELNGKDFDDKAKTIIIDNADDILRKKTRIIK
jgi:cell division initiation protein